MSLLDELKNELTKRQIISSVVSSMANKGAPTGYASNVNNNSLPPVPTNEIPENLRSGVVLNDGRATQEPQPAQQTVQPQQTGQPAQQAPQTKADTIKDILSKISAGYQDNVSNGFDVNNLAKDPNKSGWQKFGEAVGTSQRVLSNPAVQGLIAGGIQGAQKGDMLYGLGKGVEWAQNKAKSDYYQRMLQGSDYKPSIFGNYGSADYNAMVNSQYKDVMANNAKLKTEALLDQKCPKMEDYANTMLASGLWNENEYNTFISNDNFMPEQRLNMNVVKEMTNKAYKDKGIAIKDKELAAKINHWARQDSNAAARTANAKSNADRNYNLKKEKFEWDKTHPKGNGNSSNNGGNKTSYTVKVKAPNGKVYNVPENRVKEALKEGGEIIR